MPGAGVGRRKVKCQRGQRIQDAEVSGVLAVEGFDADDAHHDGGRHAVFALGPFQGALVGFPESDARLDALGFDEAGAVGCPVFGHGCGGRQDEFFDHRNALGLANLFEDPVGGQVKSLGGVLGPKSGVFARGIQSARRLWFLGFSDFGLGFGLAVSVAVFFAGRAGGLGGGGQDQAARQQDSGVRGK